MKNDFVSFALMLSVAAFAVLTFVAYIFPNVLFGGVNTNARGNANNASANSFTQSNAAAIAKFMNENNISNASIIEKLYPNNSTNILIMGCDYGISPQLFPVVPAILANKTAVAQYNQSARQEFVHTLCEANLTTINCSQNLEQLSANIQSNGKLINFSASAVFDPLREEINLTYDFIHGYNASYVELPFYAPLRFDYGFINNIKNDSYDMLNAVLDVRPLPLLEFLNGTSVIQSAGSIVPPGQFALTSYPQVRGCNNSDNILNFVSDTAMFNSSAYSYMYSWLDAKVTNICVRTSKNPCNASEMAAYNMSFYV